LARFGIALEVARKRRDQAKAALIEHLQEHGCWPELIYRGYFRILTEVGRT
jgi:hypothetical protein